MIKILNKYGLILSMLLCTTVAATENFNLTEVASGVYAHIGKHVPLHDEHHDDIANIGFIIGDTCIAVIDTGGSITIGEQLRNIIRTISTKPICYVINTHIHFDHVLGNKAFLVENPIFVGHEKLAEAIEHNRDFFLTQFKDNLGANPNRDSIVGIDMLVKGTKQLDLGNRILTLLAHPVAHSHTDLTVIDHTSQTLWAGDLIFRERTPVLDGNLKGWLTVIENLQQLQVKKIIPGHGAIADSMSDAIAQQKTYLQNLLKETRAAIAEGQFIHDAIENSDKDNQAKWLLHDDTHPANVSKAFIELEWE